MGGGGVASLSGSNLSCMTKERICSWTKNVFRPWVGVTVYCQPHPACLSFALNLQTRGMDRDQPHAGFLLQFGTFLWKLDYNHIPSSTCPRKGGCYQRREKSIYCMMSLARVPPEGAHRYHHLSAPLWPFIFLTVCSQTTRELLFRYYKNDVQFVIKKHFWLTLSMLFKWHTIHISIQRERAGLSVGGARQLKPPALRRIPACPQPSAVMHKSTGADRMYLNVKTRVVGDCPALSSENCFWEGGHYVVKKRKKKKNTINRNTNICRISRLVYLSVGQRSMNRERLFCTGWPVLTALYCTARTWSHGLFTGYYYPHTFSLTLN